MLTPNVDLRNKTVLVTGAAGFIGSNLVTELLKRVDGIRVVGFDNVNNYYDVSIKEYRLAEIEKCAAETGKEWIFIKGNLLFMICDTTDEFDWERDMARLATLPRQAEWEAYVAQFQGCRADARADEKWLRMERIF